MRHGKLKTLFAALLFSSILFYLCASNQDTLLFLLDGAHGDDQTTLEEKEIIARMLGPVSYDDPALLDIIRSKYLDAPSSEPYNLTEDEEYQEYKNLGIFVSAMHVVQHFFSNISGGTFVEAGALDGQYLSNTLDLEKNQGWTGLLVEAAELNYRKVLQKRRRAWVSHSCLALHPYPHTAILGIKLESLPEWTLMTKGQAALLDSRTSNERLQGQTAAYESVQCLPVASLLLALNITAIDFFSLDVEDVEEAIIENFPFDRITVDVWYIEHRHPNSSLTVLVRDQGPDMAFIDRFWKEGYTFMPNTGDYLFVRNGSKYSHLPPINPLTVITKTQLSYSVQYLDNSDQSK